MSEPKEDLAHERHDAEWLATNVGGSFAMGTVDRRPRRKYHGLLTIREPEIGETLNVVGELEEWFEVGDQAYALHSYDWGQIIEPHGVDYLTRFGPTPSWRYAFAGLEVRREVQLEPDTDAVWVRYSVEGVTTPLRLRLRPLLRCRPLHKLTVANSFMNGEVHLSHDGFLEASMHPYPGVPAVHMSLHGIEGAFHSDGHWYQGVHYEWERARGYDDHEDLFTPGEFRVAITRDTRLAVRLGVTSPRSGNPPKPRALPRGKQTFAAELEVAADAYLVRMKEGNTSVIAGYPWFGEWSRDALIALPGLCLQRGKFREAMDVLESLAERREGGLIPNIPKSGSVPANVNSVDASLLFVRALELTSKATRSRRLKPLFAVARDLIDQIAKGADARVHVDEQGFLFIDPGPWALTWMDALVDGTPVTPRHGYAVDINALWLSALQATLRWSRRDQPSFVKRWNKRAETLAEEFTSKFWLEAEGFFSDTHDGNAPDRRLRPNQLWALVLPSVPVSQVHAARALAMIRAQLVTPVGLRTLAPSDPAYQARYEGDQASRDRAYHQGTVWPWLLGLYADAVHRFTSTAEMRAEMRPILERLRRHLQQEGCVGQIGEVFDAEPPHRPRGAPAQAWSVAEVLRVARMANT